MSGRSETLAGPAGAPASIGLTAPSQAEVIVAGASFAGLAVAREVGGRALLVDPVPVGEGQTSACGAPVSVLEALGALSSIQERHDALILHLPGREVRWALPEPFCTFDYRRCCLDALAGAASGIIRASVLGRRGPIVMTSAGEIEGRVLVDCTGWRAALVDAGGRLPHGAPRQPPAHYFGLEAEVASGFSPGLHFYFWPEIVRDGYAWAFPAGGVTRIGVLSYRGRTKLHSGLAALLERLRMPPGPLHGGFLRADLRAPVVDGVFVVGDAGGQCLPFTGEGIRTAVWAGQACGRMIQMVLDGRLGLDDARSRYHALVARQQRRYRALLWGTLMVLVLPRRLLGHIASWMSHPGPLQVFMRHYLRIFSEHSAVGTAV
jgi:menaquinone-9 beta-reductase